MHVPLLLSLSFELLWGAWRGCSLSFPNRGGMLPAFGGGEGLGTSEAFRSSSIRGGCCLLYLLQRPSGFQMGEKEDSLSGRHLKGQLGLLGTGGSWEQFDVSDPWTGNRNVFPVDLGFWWGCGAAGSPKDGSPASPDALRRDFLAIGAWLHLLHRVQLPSWGRGVKMGRNQPSRKPSDSLGFKMTPGVCHQRLGCSREGTWGLIQRGALNSSQGRGCCWGQGWRRVGAV